MHEISSIWAIPGTQEYHKKTSPLYPYHQRLQIFSSIPSERTHPPHSSFSDETALRFHLILSIAQLHPDPSFPARRKWQCSEARIILVPTPVRAAAIMVFKALRRGEATHLLLIA